MTRITALAAALALGCAPSAFAQSGGQILNARQQFVDANGVPLAGGTVNIWQAGTTTPAITFQDSALTIANTNPVVLDGDGRASIWAPPGSYREQVLDARGDLIWDQTTAAAGPVALILSPGAAIGTSGDVACTPQTFTGAASLTLPCAIVANAVTNAKAAPMAAGALKGNNQASAANPQDLTAAQVVPMLAATASQVAAGTSSTGVLTPANFVAAGQALGQSGYVTLPGGLIEEWGYYTGPVTQNTAYTVTLPLALPNGCYNVEGTVDLNNASGSNIPYALSAGGACAAGTSSLTFKVMGYQSGGSGNATGFYWRVIGH